MGERPFELGGVNHLALVCRDMQATVDFYEGILGMPLVKTIELPVGLGQHFFFDCGGGDTLAFFWFPDAPEPEVGVSGPRCRPDQGRLASAIGSMNHVAFQVPAEKLEEYQAKLRAAGVDGPYAIALGPRCYTGVVESTEHGGYPVFEHIKMILGGPIIWAPAVNGAVVLSQRGGDAEVVIGQDFAIGYRGTTGDEVNLYLEESFTFKISSPEAAVALTYPA